MEFGLAHLWTQMGVIAKAVVVVLCCLSLWSISILAERLLLYTRATRQSLKFAPLASKLLRADSITGAIEEAKKYPQSHLAKIITAGLTEFLYERETGDSNAPGHDLIEAAHRAIEREALMVVADFKRGLGSLATIGSTAPFIGLLGTVVGIINAFRGMALSGSGGLGAVSAGIAEALVTTALGLFVAIPAVWIFNAFTNRVERFQVEMTNSGSELIDFFIKRQARG